MAHTLSQPQKGRSGNTTKPGVWTVNCTVDWTMDWTVGLHACPSSEDNPTVD